MHGTTLLPREVAERWRCTPEQVLLMIHDGELRAFDISKRGAKKPRWRVPINAVERFETARQPEAAQPAAITTKPPRPKKEWV